MRAYQPLQASPSPAYQQVQVTRQPFYITFREHYCFSPSVPVPLPDDDNTFKNGFLPSGCRFVNIEVSQFVCSLITQFVHNDMYFFSQGGVNITDETRSFSAFYETYRTEPVADGDLPDALSSASRFFGAIDIIITGEVCPFTMHRGASF
jgi:hypothetical protein